MRKNNVLEFQGREIRLDPLTELLRKGAQDLMGQAVTFRSALVPPYVRKTASLEAALPWLYLKGIPFGEMGAALKVLLGPAEEGFSAGTISRLKQVWGQEYRDWNEQRLDQDRWVYVWADGVYSGLKAEQAKLCAWVVIGDNERGEKRFLVLEDGVRESTQSWREVLLKLKSRGMNARNWPSATAPWDIGRRWRRFIRTLVSNAVGCTKP